MKTFYIEKDDYRLFAKRLNQLPENETKPTLVFLHDSWGCVEMWDDFPETLVELSGLNALVYDRRGYGRSSSFAVKQRDAFYLHDEADELMQVLDECRIQDVIIYGHSDGATIALIAGARYSNRVKGLILEGAHSFIEDSGKVAVKATRERAKKTGLLSSLRRFHGNKTNELFRLWHETWLSDYFANWTIVSVLHQIACPVLAFQGDSDEFGSIEQLNILKKEISGVVTVEEIPNAGHMPRKESPEMTIELISEFFERNKCFC